MNCVAECHDVLVLEVKVKLKRRKLLDFSVQLEHLNSVVYYLKEFWNSKPLPYKKTIDFLISSLRTLRFIASFAIQKSIAKKRPRRGCNALLLYRHISYSASAKGSFFFYSLISKPALTAYPFITLLFKKN